MKVKVGSPLTHENYKNVKHVPMALDVYREKPVRNCKWCGASPDNQVVYDMPLKDGKRAKVIRCTVCDNLIKFGAVKERAARRGRRSSASSNN